MISGARLLAGAVAAGLFAFGAGFVAFANTVAHFAPPRPERADGIVVLTGGEHRVGEAARLLAEGHGSRLLISGVNRIASREDLKRKSGLNDRLFDCCVDIGYTAHTTSGNAEETRAWASGKGFARLIIVTSSYHMPRSLTELSRAMPEATLIPHPVLSPNVHTERWWQDLGTARLLLTEYVKFLPSAARFGMARLLGPRNGSSHVDRAGALHGTAI